MQYSRLGGTGLIVSKFAFGSMTFGTGGQGPFASVYKVDQATANGFFLGASLRRKAHCGSTRRGRSTD